MKGWKFCQIETKTFFLKINPKEIIDPFFRDYIPGMDRVEKKVGFRVEKKQRVSGIPTQPCCIHMCIKNRISRKMIFNILKTINK